jgi:hypothetical protein
MTVITVRARHRLAPTGAGVTAGDSESGSAVADFAMTAALLSLMFQAVFQVGLALHIRNTLISCASEGARWCAGQRHA